MAENTMLSRKEIEELYPTDDDNRKLDSLYNDVASEAVRVAVTTDAWARQYTEIDDGITREIVAFTQQSLDTASMMAAYRLTYKAFCQDAKSGTPTELNRMHQLAQTKTSERGE